MNAKERESPAAGAKPPRKAVALKYNPEASAAPVIVAKGQGCLADEIVRRAKENGVPLQEDASLVEVLSKLDLEQEIPPELYRLVAEILSFVYRADRRAGLKQGDGGLQP
ncbi:EscU/YscU/HrcU family type III secretion system export apparatus switch protein [Cohnella lubricantis]|uniref:EscU/YscU/HrcU family type III secretion system export apparatus switch protein n=1 Tax=Cohnella lubricantis TaxID=2163172 RepID=A0A841TEW6_9BACL|nr:EscU/YscU/HrcU family type III secretion system export apparatus switch protein [Cohnella lubricantis]MBB6677011.1 EscU/YscU/HrcU family type III secretion system export apparatus switch protein [Cohnella lubricantis]MBP2117070.1 flagellar biosynthesis protein [Cohnella lubricantis]